MSIIDDTGVTLVAETNSNSVCIDHIEIRFTTTRRMKSTFNDIRLRKVLVCRLEGVCTYLYLISNVFCDLGRMLRFGGCHQGNRYG